MSDGLQFAPRPESYKPPSYTQVLALLQDLKKSRERRIAKISRMKKAVRDQWEDVLNHLPAAYRKMSPVMGFPDVAEMGDRIAGMIAKQEPIVEVVPPSAHMEDIRKAAAEEARLHAARVSIEDQQDRSEYAKGIHAQVHWGESWISVLPDPTRMPFADDDEDEGKKAVKEVESMLGFKRGKNETADDYMKRYRNQMAAGQIPIIIDDHDPQTVFPLRSRNALRACIIETEHSVYDIELGLGYSPIKDVSTGKTTEWTKGTLSEGYVANVQLPGAVVDVDHDNPLAESSTGTAHRGPAPVRKIVYMDCWCVQTYLDGVLVEQWEHNYGVVPIFPGESNASSDREPGEETRSVIEGPIAIATQLVLWAAMMTASAKLYSFPTPFVKNPEHGMTFIGNEPVTRKIEHGALNLLGVNEDIVFPFLNAHQGVDFFKNLEFLTSRWEDMALGWGKNISGDTSGYAIAQMRSLQQSILGPLYTSASRQWRKVFAMIRHIVKVTYPGGIYLRGAIETKEIDGKEHQFAPVLSYTKDDTTECLINVRIDEGIIQDELAERKSAIELHQAGAWSMRRVREKTGVEDPAREDDEVRVERQMGSQAMDQQVLILAMAMAADRYQASRTDKSSAFYQQLEAAKQRFMEQAAGAGTFQNQGAEPVNALPGGQPQAQNPAPAVPQQGGPSVGAPPIEQLGAAGLPGGVPGGQPPATGLG